MSPLSFLSPSLSPLSTSLSLSFPPYPPSLSSITLSAPSSALLLPPPPPPPSLPSPPSLLPLSPPSLLPSPSVPPPPSPQLRLWLFTLGFSLSFGALFAKTWQVYRVYTNPKLKKQVKGSYYCSVYPLQLHFLTINPCMVYCIGGS